MGTRTISAAFLTAALCRAGSLDYIGIWKLDPAKSDFGSVKIAFKRAGEKDVEFVKTNGTSYRFQLDGKVLQNEYGERVKWKIVNANTWEETVNPGSRSREAFGVATFQLSQEGTFLTWRVKGRMSSGVPWDMMMIYNRVGSGEGFFGQWEAKLPQGNESDLFEISAWRDNGLLIKGTEKMKTGCKARFDGKAHACEGPDYQPNTTMSLAERDSRTFESVLKVEGKVQTTRLITISSDGDALTVQKTKSNGQKSTLIYQRKQ